MDTVISGLAGLRGENRAPELAFRRLWLAISDGTLVAGSLQTEDQLAAELSVSRTPLREAVRRLENVGLLEREAARGLRVTGLSMSEMLELSCAREAIEGVLAAAAASRVGAGEADLAPLERIHVRFERVLVLGDPELILAVGMEFHEEIKRLAASRTAALFHDHILLAFERYRLLAAQSSERPGMMHAEHASILGALRSGDAAKAEALMRKHIRQARDVYADVLRCRLGDGR